MTLHPAQTACSTVGPLVIGALAALAPAAVAAGPAATVVETLHDRLLSVMQGTPALGHEGRAEALRPVIVGGFDLVFVARTALGEHWDRLSDGQRARFVDVFTRLTVATYAARFGGYAGERFETLAEREGRGDRVQVSTRLVKADGDAVRLDYVLQGDGDGPRIVNVVADGVSDLALKRADYTAVIQREGFDALLARLERQVHELAGAGR